MWLGYSVMPMFFSQVSTATSAVVYFWKNLYSYCTNTPAGGNGFPYSRKLSRVKTFANFAVLPAYAKVLSANFSVRGLGDGVVFSKTRKFYSRNALLYRIRESFHPRKFPAIRYFTMVNGRGSHTLNTLCWSLPKAQLFLCAREKISNYNYN